MRRYKKGEIVYWYNMYTKRKRKMRIKKALKNYRYELEYPNGATFGKRSVDGQDLSKRK